MNAKMTDQKIIKISGKDKNCKYLSTIYAVNVKV